MKASITITIAVLLAPAVLVFNASAEAKLAPVDAQITSISLDAIAAEPSGAMREQAYFSAPQPPLTSGRVFPCRMPLNVFDKTRLARYCN
jgi:hypothetical protein